MLLSSINAFAQEPPLPPCITNIDLYAYGDNTTVETQYGHPGTALHGMGYLSSSCEFGPNSTYIQFTGPCRATNQTVGYIAVNCSNVSCGILGGSCTGGYAFPVTLPANTVSITGVLCQNQNFCCAVGWHENINFREDCVPSGGGNCSVTQPCFWAMKFGLYRFHV